MLKIEVHAPNGVVFEPDLSDQLRKLLVEELELGVNVPPGTRQETELRIAYESSDE